MREFEYCAIYDDETRGSCKSIRADDPFHVVELAAAHISSARAIEVYERGVRILTWRVPGRKSKGRSAEP